MRIPLKGCFSPGMKSSDSVLPKGSAKRRPLAAPLSDVLPDRLADRWNIGCLLRTQSDWLRLLLLDDFRLNPANQLLRDVGFMPSKPG
jgi:hypothetical protein